MTAKWSILFYFFRKTEQISWKNDNGRACNFIKKETLAQVFSCEFYEISKNTFFYRTPLVAASELRASILSDYEYIIFAWKQKLFPAGTATLWQRCHNVVADVVTTLWHGWKWELCPRRFSTLWQRHFPTLSRRYNNVAATSPQH